MPEWDAEIEVDEALARQLIRERHPELESESLGGLELVVSPLESMFFALTTDQGATRRQGQLESSVFAEGTASPGVR